MTEEPKRPKPSALGDGIGLAWFFPLAIVLGGLVGRWIGGYFGHQSLGTGLGVIWGVISGFYEVFKVSRRLSKGGDE